MRKNEARCGIPVGTFIYVDANAVVALGRRRWWKRKEMQRSSFFGEEGGFLSGGRLWVCDVGG